MEKGLGSVKKEKIVQLLEMRHFGHGEELDVSRGAKQSRMKENFNTIRISPQFYKYSKKNKKKHYEFLD